MPRAKRKANNNNPSNKKAPKKAREDEKDLFFADEDDDDIDLDRLNEREYNELDEESENEDSSEEEEQETAEERRLRMARNVLQNLELDKPLTDSDESEDSDLGTGDIISNRLHQDVLRHKNKLINLFADKIGKRKYNHEECVSVYRGHRLTATCVCASSDGSTAFTGAKDATMVRWDVETGQKVFTFKRAIKGAKMQGSTSEILSVAMSNDGRYNPLINL